MNLLRVNPQLATLIHDTNGSLGSMRHYVNRVKEKLAELKVEDRTVENALEMIESSRKLALEQIDAYYMKLKANYNS